jgi:translocation protein SEC72
MVPMWSRARRFSNVYAFATLDALSVVFWLSAWAAVASYVSEGKGKGTNEKASGCDNFKFGSPGRCKTSEGVIFLGVIVMLCFAATTFVSFRAVMHYKRTGEMPTPVGGNDNFAKQTQDAFSSNIRNDDPFDDNQENLDARQGGVSGYGPARRSEDDEYALLHNNDHDDVSQAQPTQPAGPLGYGANSGGVMHDYDTSYTGSYGQRAPNADYGNAPPYGR